jgi:transmembrane sensor
MSRDQDLKNLIAEQAAHWWVLFHSEGASRQDHPEFAEWIAQSPERVAAYLRVAGLDQALGAADVPWPTTPREVLIREAKASPPEPGSLPRHHEVLQRQRRQYRSRPGTRFSLGLAATLALFVGFAWVTIARPQEFQTRLGEHRTIVLADGSHVTLNSASKIRVQLHKDRRLVELVEGEALFAVFHDVSRPFDVRTGVTVLRAVGTQFDVDQRVDHTAVTVVEGRVAVMTDGAPTEPGASPPILAAADRLVIRRSGPPLLQHGTNVQAATAWTHGQFVFERRALEEVVAEFNRYNRERIEIESPSLRREEITGTVQTADPASFIEFLASIPGVVIRDDGKGGYVVTDDASDGKHELH